jgi:DNA polymerase-3 subunit alpha
MDGFKFEMKHYGLTDISEIENRKGLVIRIAGFVTDAAHMTTKKGSKFGKLILNDYTGNTEIVFWENNYVQYGRYIDNGQKLMIQGVYQEHKYRPGVMEFNIQSIMLLDEVRKKLTKKVKLMFTLQSLTPELAGFIEQNVKTHPGNTELILQVVDEQDPMAIKLKTHNIRMELNDELIHYLSEHDEIQHSVEVA